MTLPVYITHPSSQLHDMGPGHPECPDRVRVIDDHLRVCGLLDFVREESARPAPRRALLRAHSEAHLRHLEQHAPRPGAAPIALDADTAMNGHTLDAALHAAGAAVQGIDLLCRGETQRVFCNIRPPGHHATRGQAMGFCFFNNAAIAVLHALEAHRLDRVALIDFDVHHGNGSEDILRAACDNGHALMVSSYQQHLYPDQGGIPMQGNQLNVPLPAYSSGRSLRDAVERYWLPALHAFQPQLLVISAGFDAHREDELAMLGWIESDYRWLTQELVAVAEEHAEGRILSLLEGGYALNALARSAAEHMRVLIGAG